MPSGTTSTSGNIAGAQAGSTNGGTARTAAAAAAADKRANDNMDKRSNENNENGSSGVAKRQRLSFVCQACRKNKTKCDREKPRCGRCVKYYLKCVYDVEQQKPPRVPSKDAIIKRLTGEVEYWKRKAEEMQGSNMGSPNISETDTVATNNISNGSNSNNSSTNNNYDKNKKEKSVDGISLLADVSALSPKPMTVKRSSSMVPDPQEMQLNFYREFPQITMKYSMKRDVKPISAFAHVYRDKLLSLFGASIFSSASKNALIHSLPTDDTNPFHKSETQFKQNAIFLRDSMIQLCETEIEKQKVIEFTNRIMGEQDEKKEHSSLFISLMKAKLENKHIEDSCSRGRMSPELSQLKENLEKALPTLDDMEIYKSHFYEYIYPNIPFLDIELFEEGLKELLSPNDGTDGKNVIITLGTRNIRSKICLIATLINVLRISYLCMIFTFNTSRVPVFDAATLKVLTTSPMTSTLIMLSQECISSVNLLSWTTEDGIIALMYHWAVYVFTSEEGDCYLGQPTDALISLVSNLAINIGLHRDPSHYKILNDPTICDPRIIRLRKRLWLCISIMCRHETTLKARYHQNSHISPTGFSISDDSSKSLWFQDFGNPDSSDLFSLNMNSWTIKRHQLFLLLSETDAVTMNLDTYMTLYDLDAWLEKVKTMLDEEFPLDNLINGATNSKTFNLNLKGNKQIPVNFLYIENALSFQSQLIARMAMLRITTCLMAHFENRLSETAHDYTPYFVKYFIESFRSLLELLKLYQSYLSGDYDSAISPYMRYATDKICEVCLSSVLLTFLGMLIRVTHTEYCLVKRTVDRKGLYEPTSYIPKEMKENEEKLATVTAIKKGLETAMQTLLSLITKRLRFTYFSAFKMSIFFDYVLQIIKKQDILGVLNRVFDLSFSPKVRKEVYMGTGVDINDKQAVMLALDKGNRISVASNERFQEILAVMEALQISPNNTSNEEPINNYENGTLSTLDKVSHHDTSERLSTFPLQTGHPTTHDTDLIDAYNMTTLFDGTAFDLFDYDFLLGPSE